MKTTDKNEKTTGKKFSPALEIADLELEQVNGGNGPYDRDEASPQNPFTVHPVPQKHPFWLPFLKDANLCRDDSASEERR